MGPDTDWHRDVYCGALATAADFQQVLGSLSALRISVRTHNGVEETSSLDKLRLGRVGNLVPEPSSLLLASAALAWVGWRRLG